MVHKLPASRWPHHYCLLVGSHEGREQATLESRVWRLRLRAVSQTSWVQIPALLLSSFKPLHSSVPICKTDHHKTHCLRLLQGWKEFTEYIASMIGARYQNKTISSQFSQEGLHPTQRLLINIVSVRSLTCVAPKAAGHAAGLTP